jgi:hypothetical protein
VVLAVLWLAVSVVLAAVCLREVVPPEMVAARFLGGYCVVCKAFSSAEVQPTPQRVSKHEYCWRSKGCKEGNKL